MMRESGEGKWLIKDHGAFHYGHVNDVPLPGKYAAGDLDGQAVYRKTNSKWFIRGISRFWYGQQCDMPVTR